MRTNVSPTRLMLGEQKPQNPRSDPDQMNSGSVNVRKSRVRTALTWQRSRPLSKKNAEKKT